MQKTKHRESKPEQIGRLDSEVACLFGRKLVQQSKKVSIDALAIEADQVAEAARQLSGLSGKPDLQRKIIRAMDEETAIALCKWIREPSCMDLFIAQGVH